MDLRAEREQLFANLAHPDTVSAFFDRVADDVDWTVEGTHPIAGHWTDKTTFVAATFDRLRPLMRDPIRLELRHLFLDGDTVVVELQAMSTTLDGSPYDYVLCWICRFDAAEPGATIVEVRAHLDSAMVTWTITRNEQLLAQRTSAPDSTVSRTADSSRPRSNGGGSTRIHRTTAE